MSAVTTHVRESDHVRAATSQQVNERLDREIQQSLQLHASSPPDQIAERIDRLDREWDFDRVLEAESASMALTGLALGLAVNKRFLILPGFVAGMVLLHALHGWYPLLPIFRRLGIRSRDEIERERYGLKALRGDFEQLSNAEGHARADAAWQAVLL